LQQLIGANKTWYKWALYDREPLEQWHVGRATLLGDSALATLPYLGQGAAMAIEDAYVLTSCLSKSEDPNEALEVYEQLRKPRTRRVVLTSRARARKITSPRRGTVSSETSGLRFGTVLLYIFLNRMGLRCISIVVQ
jgi:salicylate hydroxylase